MTKRQRIVIYSITLFIMIWGLDLIDALKFNKPVDLQNVFSIFQLSHLIYAGSTLLLMSYISRRFFLKKNYIKFVCAIAALILFFILIRYSIEQKLYPLLWDASNYPSGASLQYYILDNIYYASVYIGIGFLLFLLDMQISNQKKHALLMQQNKEAELQFLRSQVNPHFLFNTLNNIYSLVYEQSPQAPAAMLQLSELMRYILYEKKETVPVSREWAYIENFITLQKLRFDYQLPVEFSFDGKDSAQLIPPYLLIPFIENAFKHGDFRQEALKIKLAVTDRSLLFETSNYIGTQNKDEAGGIGLDNVRRRLELMYPGQHRLNTTIKDGFFSASLTLNF